MRLIDADALSDLLVKTYEKAPTEKALLFVSLLLKNNEEVPTVEQKYYDRIVAQINPVIEARPQGEWARHDEWRGGEYIGGFFHVNCPCDDGYYSKWETNFCPNCGQPMTKGGAE